MDTLLRNARVSGAVLALAPSDPHWCGIQQLHGKPVHKAVGGTERRHSVLNALEELAGLAAPDDWVLVHDAARPCLSDADLDKLIGTLMDDPIGGILAMPVRDTLKRGEQGRIGHTVDREGLWHAMTPQMFRYGLLLECMRAACAEGTEVTDEAAAIERAGHRPRLVEGSWENFKVTKAEDLKLAEFLLERRRGP